MSINWKLGLTPVSELTLENFPDFARDYAEYAYSLCFKATLDEKQAVTLGAETLAAVACKEAGKEGSDALMPDEAIKRVLLDVLSKQQLAQLNRDDIKIEKQPDEKMLDAMVDKATNLANSNMPRYARVFSGTKGTLVILGLVAVLMAAIVLIWLNPNACNTVSQSGAAGKTGSVDAAARPDTDMLINVVFDDSAAEKVNSGSHPVVFRVDGPDSRAVTSVSVVNSAGVPQDTYPCGEYEYCFIPTQGDVFQTIIGSDIGQMSAYYIVPPIEAAENAPENKYYAVSHNNTVFISLEADETVTVMPLKGTMTETFGGMIYTPLDGSEGVGLDSFTYVCADGSQFTVPVLVSNSSPYIEPDSLSASVRHTPSRAGMLAGNVTSRDADGDSLIFSLTETVGCSAMISPDGSYVVLVEPEYRAEEASFSFTVSDGIIVSDPYTVSVELENDLISATEMNVGFVCYAGEDGYYYFDLPAADNDGDVLEWTLVTETENGLTVQWKSEILIEDGCRVRYRISPELNEDFVEALTFSCSDGWISGTLMTVICSNSANEAPRSSGRNNATITSEQKGNVLEVTIVDDCEFDECKIVSVNQVYGGTVADNQGWDELRFTFTPDGTETYCSVVLTVADKLTGLSTQIVYDIVVE